MQKRILPLLISGVLLFGSLGELNHHNRSLWTFLEGPTRHDRHYRQINELPDFEVC